MSPVRDLFRAIDGEDRAAAEQLLRQGASVNGGLDLGTPLSLAIRKSSLYWVRLLADGGCDVNLRDASGESPLCLSLLLEESEIATFLIRRGCSVNRESAELGLPPISIALSRHQSEVAKLLIQAGCDGDKQDGDGRTPLHHAVLHRQYEIAEALIKTGCKINVRCKTSGTFTPLHLAVVNDDLHMVRTILSAEKLHVLPKNQRIVDVNKRTTLNGQTALHYAASHGSLEIVKELTRSGADVNAADMRGNVPLVSCILSSSVRRYDVAAALMSSSHEKFRSRPQRSETSIDCSDASEGMLDPLCIAVRNGDERMLDLLLLASNHSERSKAEARPRSARGGPSRAGSTTRKLAASTPGGALLLACLNNELSERLLDRLLAAAADGYVSLDASGWPSLHAAAVKCPESLPKLIHHGLDIGVMKNWPSRSTILHQTDCLRNPGSVQSVLRLGACAEWRLLPEKSTPLHVLAECGDEEAHCWSHIVQTATLLIDYGADVNARDIYQMTPARLAIQRDNLGLLHHLLLFGARLHPSDISDTTGLAVRLAKRLESYGNGNYFQRLLESATSGVGSLKSVCLQALGRHFLACGARPISVHLRQLGLPRVLVDGVFSPITARQRSA